MWTGTTVPMIRRTILERITRNNSAICLIDHQLGLLVGVHDITVAELKHNVVALALWGPTFPELVAVLDTKKHPIIDRMTMNAWDDPHFVKAVEATGRTHLLFAGVTLQVCAALPAYSALAAGYTSYVVIDASGVLSATNRQVGIARIQQAGVIPVDYFSIVCEIMATNADPSANEVYAALDQEVEKVMGQFSEVMTSKAK